MILEARKAEESSPPMQDHIADLSDMLQKLNKQEWSTKSELRQMAKSSGLPQKKDGLNIDVPTLLQNIQQASLQEVESLRESRSNLESPAASSSGGEHPAVRQILQDVLEFGQLPKEVKSAKTHTEVAERKLAEQVRKHKLRERAQEMLEKLKASMDTSSDNPCTASGGSHSVANLPHSAASATIQEPSPFLKKRLRQKTTAPHYGRQFAPTPSATSQEAKPSNKGIKRKTDDPDSQNIGDAHVAAPANAMANKVSGKRKSCGDRHPAESRPLSTHRTQRSPAAIAGQLKPLQTDISTLPQLDAAILQQVRHLGYYPREERHFKEFKTQEQKDEVKLFYYIRRHLKKLHTDTRAELDAWKKERAATRFKKAPY